jgi:predicted dehydrogenase
MANIPLRTAFIGGGHNSAVGNCHRIALEMDKRFKLVAGVFSLNLKDNFKTGVIHGIEKDRIYKSIAALVANEKNHIDCIVVLTPQPSHFENLKQVLKSGIPIICEKTMVSNSKEARVIADLCKNKNLFLEVINNYTGYPMVREFRNLIKTGTIGSIHSINFEMPQEGFSRKTFKGKPIMPQSWRLQDGKLPTIYLDLGIHLQMLSYYLLGKLPRQVIANESSKGNFKNIIDDVHCLLKFEKNISGHIWFSKSALGYKNGLKLKVFGSKGSIQWLQNNPEKLLISDNHGLTKIIERGSDENKIANRQEYQRFKAGHPAGFIEAFANNYFSIANNIIDYRKKRKLPENNPELNIKVLQIMERMHMSSRKKVWM